MKKDDDLNPDKWAVTVRVVTHSVYAFERTDRSNSIFVKFSSPEKEGRDRRVRIKLPGHTTVRDKKGRIDPKRVREVLREVERFTGPLIIDQAPTRPVTAKRPLTLREGFSHALDHVVGKYPTRTRRWDEVNR